MQYHFCCISKGIKILFLILVFQHKVHIISLHCDLIRYAWFFVCVFCMYVHLSQQICLFTYGLKKKKNELYDIQFYVR